MAGSHGDIWKKRILLPLWIIQLGALVIFFGLSAFALWVWNRVQDDVADYDPDLANKADSLIDAGSAVNLAFAGFTILLDFVEMILFCTHRLAPVINIVMQSIKSAIWTFYLIAAIVSIAKGAASPGSLFLVLVIFITSIGLLSYGAKIMHQKRKGTLYRGNYAAASTGGATGYEPYAGTSTQPNPFRDPSPAPPYNPHSTYAAHKPPGAAGEYYGGGSYEMQHGVVR